MARVRCGGKSVALNITVPVARHLYPSAAWECVSVTSMAGVTRTPTVHVLLQNLACKPNVCEIAYFNWISISFYSMYIVFVPQCQSFKKYILTRVGRTLFNKGKFQVVHSAECFIKILFCYTNACFVHQQSYNITCKIILLQVCSVVLNLFELIFTQKNSLWIYWP